MRLVDNRLYADEGKVLRRINGLVYGAEVALGYVYYINGVLQNPPHLDTPADFEEIDISEEDVIFDEET